MMALITALRDTQEQKLDMGLSVNLDYSLCTLILFYLTQVWVEYLLVTSVSAKNIHHQLQNLSFPLLLTNITTMEFSFFFFFFYPASDVHAVQWT